MGTNFNKYITSSNLNNDVDIILLRGIVGFNAQNMAMLKWDGTNHQVYISPMATPYDTVYINFDGNIKNSLIDTDFSYPSLGVLQELSGDTYFTDTGSMNVLNGITENNTYMRLNNCSLFFNGGVVTPYTVGCMFDLNCEFHGDPNGNGVLVILGTYTYVMVQ